MSRNPISWLLVFAITIVLLLQFCAGAATSRAVDSENQGSEVRDLIQQLGSDSYATRVRAKEKLQRMGLEAFDELHDAQFSPDNEISMAARFLVSSLLVSWSKESDPPEVREVLIEYGAQDESERSSRIDMLAEFPGRRGLPALVRLARFETSLRLSRHAALAIMHQPMATDRADQRRNAEHVLEILGDNDRQAAQWLRVYAQDLSTGKYSAERWHRLIAEQREQIDSAATQQSSRQSVLELVRVSATRAANAGLVDEALRLAIENMDLISPTSKHLIDACSWAIDNNLHPFVLELRRQHQRMFDQQPILLYGAAEAVKLKGDQAEAENLARAALRIKPLPQNEEQAAKMQPKEVELTAQAHREIGKKLEERGLFHWAEREFRHIIDSLDIDDRTSVFARFDLAQMSAELQHHQAVIDTLSPLVERVEKDGKFRQQLNIIMFNFNRVRSDVAYHRALILIDQGKEAEAGPLLMRALQLYPTNIDILIRMYRMDGDPAWNKTVRATLQRTIRQVDIDVQDWRNQTRQRRRNAELRLAQELNQYAWLVSNTEGDYRKALDYSLESLEIETDGAKLDTCARCYFAVGDYENAIRMQKRALKLMPHSPPLRRQLGEFEAAAAKATSQSKSP